MIAPGLLFGLRLAVSGFVLATAPLVDPQAAAKHAVAQAVGRMTLPANLSPSLAHAQADLSNVPSYLGSVERCDAKEHSSLVASPHPCVLGDTSARRTVVLFGDSSSFNWAPALSIAMAARHYRVELFTYSGCPAPQVAMTTATVANPSACALWHQRLARVVRTLRPVAIIGTTRVATGYSDAQWAVGWKRQFAAMTTGHGSIIRVVLGTSPTLPKDVPICVSEHQGAIAVCALHYNGNDRFFHFLIRDGIVAKASGAVLIPTVPWLCARGTCPVVIGRYLVYRDTYHLWKEFARSLAPALGSALSQQAKLS